MAPATQTAVTITAFDAGNPTSTLKVVNDHPVAKPKAGEVLLHVTARPVNPADVFSIMGVYPGFLPPSLPAVPGIEGAGVVEDANGTAHAAGTRGFIMPDPKAGNGTWQQYMTIAADRFIPVPAGISDTDAAQIFVNATTVWGMLSDLAAPQGEYIVQTAAGSTLGRMLIAVAKKKGLKTINIVRRPEQVAELKALGADEVLCSEEEGMDISANIKEITGGKGAWGAVECVCGSMTAKVSGGLRDGGLLLVYGALTGLEFTGSVVDALFRGVTYKGWWMLPWLEAQTAERKKAINDEIFAYMLDKTLVPNSGETFPLEKIVEAVAKSQQVGRGGKVLLV